MIPGLDLAKKDQLAIEGLHFMGKACTGNFGQGLVRLVNCSFDPGLGELFGRGFGFPRFRATVANDTSIEIINCVLGRRLEFDLPPGQSVRVRNSCLGNLAFWRQPAAGENRLELDHCLLWYQHGHWGRIQLEKREQSKSALAIHARKCFFDLPHGLRGPKEALRWSGDDNLFRFRGMAWWGEKPPGECIWDLAGWQRKWGSDEHSADADPGRFDPRQWQLLPSSPGYRQGPDGRDYGADVSKQGLNISRP